MTIPVTTLRTVAVALLSAYCALKAAADSWKSLGPYGGILEALVSDPKSSSILYAGTWLGGVYKSVDRGSSWFPSGLGNDVIFSVAVDPKDSRTVYAGTFRGLFRSRDGGVTWSAVTNIVVPYIPGPPEARYASQTAAIVFDPVTPSAIYLATVNDVFVSTDDGASFVAVQAPFRYVRRLAVHPANPKILLAGTMLAYGIARSSDGGKSWSVVMPSSELVTSVVFDPNNPEIAHASTEQGLYTSDDGGITWRRRGPLGLLYGDLAIDPIDSRILYAGTRDSVYRSVDAGATWQPFFERNLVYVTDILISPDDGRMLVATNDGVAALSTEGWVPASAGLNGEWVFDVVSNGAAIFAFDLTRRNYRSLDSGKNWSRLALPFGHERAEHSLIDPRNPSTVYIATRTGFIRSDDGGEQWAVETPEGSYLSSKTLGYSPADGAIILGDGEFFEDRTQLHRTLDGGRTWERLSSVALDIRCILVHPTDPNILFAGMGGNASDTGGVYKSIDGGRTWTRSNSGLDPSDLPAIVSMEFDPRNPEILYAGAEFSYRQGSIGNVFKSTDGGATWRPAGSGLPATFIFDVLVHPQSPNVLFAATHHGVYVSRDGAQSWSLLDGVDGATSARAISISNGLLRVAVLGGGVWERPLTGRTRAVRRR